MAAEAKRIRAAEAPLPGRIRCAIYTRKSTDEGLDQPFNSLDAQRESAESYIRSQKDTGWFALADRYDDGGFTGANMDRPALKRLLADVETGKVDSIIVYRLDRLTRRVRDFATIIDKLEGHKATFVSVTEQFNTTTSIGRLALNIVMSFAEFERETIAERTRDKMRAARRKGKWIGGNLVLGYDVAPGGGRLVINAEEATRVREIFCLYRDLGSLIPVIEELERRGWRMKEWKTREGRLRGGASFQKNTLYNLLTNLVYTGRIKFEGEIRKAEHERILDDETWERVQTQLARNGRKGGRNVRNKFNGLLKGMVRCGSCGAAMIHTYAQKKETRYRYYVCSNAHQRGWNKCATRSVSAPELEGAVVERLRMFARQPAMLSEVLERIRENEGQPARSIPRTFARPSKASIRSGPSSLRGSKSDSSARSSQRSDTTVRREQ